jgi:hypothetical protein
MCIPFWEADSWKAENAITANRTIEDSEHIDAKKDLVVDHLGPISTEASIGGKNICRNPSSRYSLSIELGLSSDDISDLAVAIAGSSCKLICEFVKPTSGLVIADIMLASVGEVHIPPRD